MKGSIDSIETLGLVDGPGIRCVVFLNGCNLRCKYCHNPEMWCIKENNYTVDELVNKIKERLLKDDEIFAVTISIANSSQRFIHSSSTPLVIQVGLNLLVI